VTVQAQILELLRDLNRDLGTSIILITHNLGVVAGLCTRVVVMYAGEIVEQGPPSRSSTVPQHPYTWALLRSLPRVDSARLQRLPLHRGPAARPHRSPPGCKFNPRCPFRLERCFSEAPS
jgi:peptide/nickel transport system ATP-binding protein